MEDTSVMRTKDWIVTYLVMMIPCIGFIMMFVWAFGSSGNVNRRNYARAILIIIGIVIALYLVVAIIFGVVLGSMWNTPAWDWNW